MNRGPLAFGVIIGLSAFPLIADAQSAGGLTPEGMVKGRQARVFSKNVALDAVYDTNVSRASKGFASQRNITPQDWTYTPSATVSLIQPIGRQAVFLDATGGYRFHDKNKRLDRTTFSASGGVGASVGPCGGVASGLYAQSSAQTETETEADIVDFLVENIRKTRQVNASVTCVHSSGLGVIVSGSKAWVKSDLQQSRVSDHDTTTIMTGLTYARPQLATFTLFGTVARTLYPNRLTVDSTRNGFESKSVGLQAVRQFGARIEATVSGGYTKVDGVGGRPLGAVLLASDSFSGLTYAAGVSYRASSRLRASADFQRSVSPSLVTTGSFQVRTGYSAAVNYRVGSRIAVELNGARKDIDVRGVGVSTIAPTLTNSSTTVFGGSVRYKQSERVSLSVGAEHEKRSSDNALFNYTADRVMISTALSF